MRQVPKRDQLRWSKHNRLERDRPDTLSHERVRDLLSPFGLDLPTVEIQQLLAYLSLLQRWNHRINLTAVHGPEECITRHFGESLYLGRRVQLQGRNLDVGSGAGFPGLALKLTFPNLKTTLLEPISKKRAFLKEVVRTCGMSEVEIRPERLVDCTKQAGRNQFDSVTSRAVGHDLDLMVQSAECLVPNGLLCLWTTLQHVEKVGADNIGIAWDAPLPIPGSRERVILVGRKLAESGKNPCS